MLNHLTSSNIVLISSLQSLTILTVVVFLNVANQYKCAINLASSVQTKLSLLIIWNLASLPLSINFLLKLNIALKLNNSLLPLFFILMIINTFVVLLYMHFFTDTKLLSIGSKNYTLLKDTNYWNTITVLLCAYLYAVQLHLYIV